MNEPPQPPENQIYLMDPKQFQKREERDCGCVIYTNLNGGMYWKPCVSHSVALDILVGNIRNKSQG
jgi:hypothetical protein